jgi:protein ImuB
MSASLQRRYLSLWLRRLATDRIATRRIATTRLSHSPACVPDKPLVVTRLVKGALRIVAMDDAAWSLGLQPGMPLADARAMYPALAVAENDEEADRRLIDAVADWCDRYTPLVGFHAPDGLVLDIAGCAHLFGGEAAMCRDILARLADQGLHARAAIADTVGCAFAVARFGGANSFPPCGEGLGVGVGRGGMALPQLPDPPPRPSPTRGEGEAVARPQLNLALIGAFLVAPGGMRHALAPLPMAALRLAPEIVEALAELGLKRIADIIDLPRAPLAARFSEILVRRLDQALGRDDEPITPRLPVPCYVAEQSFPDPIGLERDVLATIARLAAQLDAAMERRQDGARLLQVALFRTDNKVYRIEVGTGAPVRDAARIVRLFADRLAMIGDACDPGFGFDMVRLAALVTERSEPVQSRLAPGALTSADDEEFSHLIDRLGARFGGRRVTRLVERDTHIPELAVAAVPASRRRMTEDRGRMHRLLHPSSVLRHPSSDTQDSLSPTRPVRLFGRPEPVEVVAEVPDGPPARFRWRRVLHEVATAEGPERIAMEWWRDTNGQALTRDYFRVESREGLRAWLYREGLYDRATPAPRWFLHGLFG